jgi:hypothetical protein
MPVFRSLVVRSLCCIVLPLMAASGQGGRPAVDLGLEAWVGRASGRVLSNHEGVAVQGVASWRVGTFSHGAVLAGGAIAAQGIRV